MKIFRFGPGMWIFAFLILVPSLLTAGDATNQLSATIDDFVPIITNIPSAELRANGLPESARKLVLARFDFSEMTRRSLGRQWKVYDMVIDDVDLAKNFRAQFERVIAKSSLKELLERMKDQSPGS